MFRHPHSSQHVRLTTTNSPRLSLYSTPPLWLIVLCLGAKLMTNFLHWPNYKPGNPPLSLPFLLSSPPSSPSLPPLFLLATVSLSLRSKMMALFCLGQVTSWLFAFPSPSLLPSPFSLLPLPSPSPFSLSLLPLLYLSFVHPLTSSSSAPGTTNKHSSFMTSSTPPRSPMQRIIFFSPTSVPSQPFSFGAHSWLKIPPLNKRI